MLFEYLLVIRSGQALASQGEGLHLVLRDAQDDACLWLDDHVPRGVQPA
jgi:hypothetical protein